MKVIVGVIKTRDLLLHPFDVFQIQGLWGFFRLFAKVLSRKKYHFVDLIEITTRTLMGRKAR